MIKQEFSNFLKASQTKKLMVNGVEWEYFVTGESASTVLILTGGGSIAEAAFMYINSLASTSRVITPSIPAVNSVAECLNGIKAILANERITQTSILGFSMGGMLAQ